MTELETAKGILAATRQRAVVLELGAHHGHDTIELYDASLAPLYVAVEADPRNMATLLNTIGTRHIRCGHYAVAAHSGTSRLYLSSGPDATGSSSIREPQEHLLRFPETRFTESVSVPSLTLDALAALYGVFEMSDRVDLIWCDIQGAERDMIDGGPLTLARTRYLLCECDAIEMYRGQVTRADLLTLLPGWTLVTEWPENANVLLRNDNI